jgi:hypothetical protein
MSHRSPAEVGQDHVQALGQELGPVYTALCDEVVWLHGKWSQYRQLFATSEDRIELLNNTAGYFFGVLQHTMLDDVQLHLARLTDPARTMGHDNLSLRQLPELVTDPTLKSELMTLVDRAGNATTVARDWRNRRIAHSDLGLALATSADPLDGVSRADVETALDAVRKTVNRIEHHYFGGEVMYQHPDDHGGNANRLVRWLARGWRAHQRKHQRLADGKPYPEDSESEPVV